jgi:hypothetical protein
MWKKGLRIAVAVLLSMLLAYLTEVFVRHNSTTLTLPGDYIAYRVVPVPPPPNELSTIGETILVAFAVDSACYFVLISALSEIARKLRNKPDNRSNLEVESVVLRQTPGLIGPGQVARHKGTEHGDDQEDAHPTGLAAGLGHGHPDHDKDDDVH